MKSLFLIFFYSLTGFLFRPTPEPIVVKEGVGIDGIVTIGESKKSIILKYGKSDQFLIRKYKKMASTHPHNVRSSKTKFVEKLGRSRHTFYYSELSLFIGFDDKDHVRSIYYRTEKYRTVKGLSIGDTRQKAYSLYKEGDDCQPILQNPSEGIDIIFECNQVKEIRIYEPR